MLARHKGEIPFAVYLLPLMAGMALSLNSDLSRYQQQLQITFYTLALTFVILNLLYRTLKLYRHLWLGGALIHLLLFAAGALSVIRFDDRNHADYFEHTKADALLIRINNEPQLRNGFVRFTATAELAACRHQHTPVSGQLLVSIPVGRQDSCTFSYGDEMIIPSGYRPVDPPFNPAEFNYKQYLARQNIYAQAFLQPGQAMVLNHHAGNALVDYSLRLRQQMVALFKQQLHSREAIAVASTLILGYKAELDNEVLQAYSQTGTIHVLSVSGAHVAILFMLISWLLGFMSRNRYGRVLSAVIAILLIWYYALLTGLSPAVCRAAVMISMVIAGKTWNRHISTLNILAASAFVLLILNPFLLTDAGFQLSYLAVAGLVIFQPIIYNWLDISNRWLDQLWLLCSASLAAQAATFALSIYYFHQFPVYFLASNLFILLPSVVIMYAGMAYLLFAALGFTLLAKPVGLLLEYTILLMDKGLALIARQPYAYAGKLWINLPEQWLLFILVILLFALCYYKRPVIFKLSSLCLLLFSISISVKHIGVKRTSSVTFLNLKKHTGILFRQGTDAVLITDLADTDKIFHYSVQPGADSCGIRKLTVCRPEQNIATGYLRKQGGLIRFLNQDILLINPLLDSVRRGPPLQLSCLFVDGSPHPDWTVIDNAFNYRQIITGSNNSQRLLDTLRVRAATMHKKIYMLRRNKSIILKSN